MTQPFVLISYSRQDEAEKDILLTHLKGLQQAKQLTVWSDGDIEPGNDWPEGISQAIAQADIALLLVTANYLASDFIVQKETPELLARHTGKKLRIIPIIAKPCAWQSIGWLATLPVRPSSHQPVWRDGGRYADQELAAIATEIVAAYIHNLPLAPTEAILPDCPYRGLFAFRPEHTNLFFGRETFTKKLVQAVESRSLTAVLGASGSGKSSVVFAGLVPALATTKQWLFTTFRPGNDPFFNLANALVPLIEPQLSKIKQIGEARDLADRLHTAQSPLADYITAIHQAQPDHHLLLIADQFEELYTLCRDPITRQEFLNLLLNLLFPDSENHKPLLQNRLALVLTLRADFLGQALSYRPFADALQDTDLKLGPMTRQELTEAVEKPALLQNVLFEEELIDRILDDVGQQESGLPLLEFALVELWQRQKEGRLTHTAYERIGQIRGALSRHADQVYERLSSNGKTQVRQVFVQLVTPGIGAEDTRRLATKAELESSWPLVIELANERLVVTNRLEDNRETAELAHEALIRHWERLRGWIAEDRDFRTWQENFRTDMKQWQASQDMGDLLNGTPLFMAKQWLVKRAQELSPAETEFIQHSLANDRSRKGYIILFLALAGGLGAAIGAGFFMSLAGYVLWQPDSALNYNLPRPITVFIFGLIGVLLGGGQGIATTLGFTLVEVLMKNPRRYYRLLGGVAGGGLFGTLLFLIIRLGEAMPSGLSYGTVFMTGVLIFTFSSGAITLSIPKIGQQRSLAKQSILGAVASGAACFIAVSLSYLLLDMSAGTAFWGTALGYVLLEAITGGGMALGVGIASRLGYMLRRRQI
jgi:hypothetical protein